ncbi:M2 family metallopeptidase [bacterium]|nr:M2 family metallopeptidase [bacterium]MBU1072797.1 M2 family metallopeptidase [bacterium]MBU1676756.1 M2 family metallopeptidase [bacterium]
MRIVLLIAAASVLLAGCQSGQPDDLDAFLAGYDILYRDLWRLAEGARWDANVDIGDAASAARIAAEKEFAEKLGNAELILTAQEFLKRDGLSFEQRKQLEYVLLNAAKFPGTIPETTTALIEAEAAQNERLYGFEFSVQLPGEAPRAVTANEIATGLTGAPDPAARRAWWEASKEIGPSLREGLLQLRDLRNETAGSMGYSSFFALEVSEYGLTPREMIDLMDEVLAGLMPLYRQLHCWVRHELAARYGEPVPRRLPAHWLGNRWAQAWPGIVEGIDLDALVADKTPEWLITQAERYYTSMGFPPLPAGFWENSDLYAVGADSERKKNTHASAWHIDLDQDVRSLMSVEPTFDWLQTTHHELGHVYYYLAYSNPDVPFVLRTGANRAFHEGIGTLIELVSSQTSYLRMIDLLGEDEQIDHIQWLLNQALLGPVTFLPFACGTMTHWEHDFYEEPLPADQMNARWWRYVGEYQGVAPPEPRGEEWCDAATKTHISDDPAQYYDYALSSVVLHQLHDHICREILHEAPQTATYYKRPEVGAYLREILRPGATRDWRELMVEATGGPLSSRAMLEYYQPLREWLEEQNAGRDVTFD